MGGENVDVWRVAFFTKQIRILKISFLSVLINTDARLIKLKILSWIQTLCVI